jgi:hypothetical protein
MSFLLGVNGKVSPIVGESELSAAISATPGSAPLKLHVRVAHRHGAVTTERRALIPALAAVFTLDGSSQIGTVVQRVIQNFCLSLPLSNPKVSPVTDYFSSPEWALRSAWSPVGAPDLSRSFLPCRQMLEMFKDRDREPLQPLLPWSGEFAGKYLTHCVQLYRLSSTPELKTQIEQCLTILKSYQMESGYIGPFPSAFVFKQGAPNCPTPWDAW